MRLKSTIYESTLSTAPRRFFIKGDARKWYVSHSSLAASHSSPISSPISLNRAIQSFASSFFTIWIAMPAWTRT